ncbi:cell cycle checkpoint control protein RAD9A-like [Diaphorina citri]|uniref:Cell cycle checkpoint control protein RAD9A-like n=1 Tax=Diaphorina citri TaxID=121845 RepID=A0A3Q0IYW4_DIACI|nr:cell cycle checkpoint control protein RAD9A-like [Diaphorina citri]
MKGVLFNQSVKVLSRAIHSLARIGDDMVVEPFKHGLKLSTVDKSESAYTQFWFPVSFFYSYKYDDTENPDDLRLKISFKVSTEYLFRYINDHIDAGYLVVSVFYDLSSAFDLVE